MAVKVEGTVISVGEGRGFFIEAGHSRYIITAAHVLGELSPAFSYCCQDESIKREFVGRLGNSKKFGIECLFADPIADLAVLGKPEHPDLFKEAQAFDKFADSCTPFPLGRLRFRRTVGNLSDGKTAPLFREAECDGLLMSLSRKWFGCRIMASNRIVWISKAERPIEGGMSGSPIVLPDGSACGIVCTADGSNLTNGGPNPILNHSLPAWLVREAKFLKTSQSK